MQTFGTRQSEEKTKINSTALQQRNWVLIKSGENLIQDIWGIWSHIPHISWSQKNRDNVVTKGTTALSI